MLKILSLLAMAALSTAALAQQKSAADGIAEYRAMLADGNPAELFEARGEDLWKKKRGPKNASLEQCDLGKGPGVVKGAFVELPRWFADTSKVQDLESRLLTCMETLQGLDAKAIAATPLVKVSKWVWKGSQPGFLPNPKVCALICRNTIPKKK